MTGIELAIDLGSSNITIYQNKIGVVLKEPSVIICEYKRKGKLEAIAVGNDAINYKMGYNDNNQIVFPIKDGHIINKNAAKLMLSYFTNKVVLKSFLKSRITILACVSCGLTVVEKKAIEEVFNEIGYPNVYIIESALAVYKLVNKNNSLIINMGSDNTDVAVVSDNGIVCGCAINIAGNLFNNSIVNYFIENYGVYFGKYAVEKAKKNISSILENDISTITVQGRNKDNQPQNVEMTVIDIRNSILPHLNKLVEVIDTMLTKLPPDIIQNICDNGIYLCGGSSNIQGISEFFNQELSLNVNLIKYGADSVVYGAGVLLNDKISLAKLINISQI